MGHFEDSERRLPKGRDSIPEPEEAELQQVLRGRLMEFVVTAQARQISPLPLETYDGRKTYRSRLRGWVLLPATGLAVGTDAQLYCLRVAIGRLASKAPVPEDRLRSSYWHGWSSTQVTLEEMLANALLRGLASSPQ